MSGISEKNCPLFNSSVCTFGEQSENPFLQYLPQILKGRMTYACFCFCPRYSYLRRYITEPLPCRGDEWQPLVWYRNSLLANEDEESSVLGSLGEWPRMGSSKTSSFKRKLSNGTKTSQFLISCIFFVCLSKLLYLLFCFALANLYVLKCISCFALAVQYHGVVDVVDFPVWTVVFAFSCVVVKGPLITQ